MEHQTVATEFFREQLSKHFVTLCMGYMRLNDDGSPIDGRPIFKSYSGFLLSFRGEWCVITAGHVVQEILKVADSPNGFVNTLVLGFDFGNPCGDFNRGDCF